MDNHKIMAKKETLIGQLADRSNALPGGLQTLVRGGSLETTDEPQKKPVGRPRKDEDVIHTSLVIDRELYKTVKKMGFDRGHDLRIIITEALEQWVERNS